jgi:hypothetical protein
MARRLGKGAGTGAPCRRHPWRWQRPWCTCEGTTRCLNMLSKWGGGARTSRRRLGHGMGTERRQREAGTAATPVVGRCGRRVTARARVARGARRVGEKGGEAPSKALACAAWSRWASTSVQGPRRGLRRQRTRQTQRALL